VLLAIEIHVSGNCPAAAEVEQRMAPLLGAGTAARTSDVATIKHAPDGGLSVSLDDRDGRPIGDRRFPRGGTCGDQAERIAVTLAIWEAQIHPEITLRLDRLSPEAVAPAPTTPADLTTRQLVPPAVVVPAVPTTLSLGPSIAGDWQSGAWVPAGRAELGLGRGDSRWRARLAAIGVGRHTQDVAPGQASWWRAALALGVDHDLARGRRWALVLGGGVLGGVVSVAGSGYAVNRASRSLDGGAEVRARGEWRPGPVRPWVGVSVVGWLRRQNLDLQGAASASILPRVEPMVGLGADFVW
jgi:hypothetical protein